MLISDTAGIRETHDPIEKKGVQIATDKAQDADLKIILLDAKNPCLMGFDRFHDENSLIAINKSDNLR